MHDGEMTSVFVGRPFAGVRPPLEKRNGDLPDERHYDVRSALEGVDDTRN
jgi:hypothetical protein